MGKAKKRKFELASGSVHKNATPWGGKDGGTRPKTGENTPVKGFKEIQQKTNGIS